MDNTLKIHLVLSKDCSKKSFMFKNCSSLILIKFKNNLFTKEDILFNFDSKPDEKLNKNNGINNCGEILLIMWNMIMIKGKQKFLL